MTCILIGHKYQKHRLGTVYGTTTLDSVATGINACGTFTTSLPASPSTNQIVTINNTCTGTITVSGNGNNIGAVSSVTLAAGISGKFYWDGYTWGVWYHNNSITALVCAASVLNATHDFGTTTQGPAETAYSVPANTVEYSGWWVNACGETVRKVVTTTYAGRGVTDQWKHVGVWRRNDTACTPNYNSGEITTYGSSLIIALFAGAAIALAGAPATVIYHPVAIDYHCYSPYLVGEVIYYLFEETVPGGLFPPTDSVSSQLTLYYLDTQIVWTYETL